MVNHICWLIYQSKHSILKTLTDVLSGSTDRLILTDEWMDSLNHLLFECIRCYVHIQSKYVMCAFYHAVTFAFKHKIGRLSTSLIVITYKLYT